MGDADDHQTLSAASAANSIGGPVYFLLHIPKTAGQTIQQHLAAHCAAGVFWQSRGKHRPDRPPAQGNSPDFSRSRVLAGHHLGRSMEAYFTGRELRRIILLRDPISFHVSFYNWQILDHIWKGRGTYSFDLYLRAQPRDFVAHFLLSRWAEIPWSRLLRMSDEEKYEILNRTLAGFWFVGDYTACDPLIAAIAADLGIPPTAPRHNSSARMKHEIGREPLRAETLSQRTRDAVLAHSRIDCALWESWRGARFEADQVRPRPLEHFTSGFLAHEMVRPWFAFERFLRREWAPRLRLARSGGLALARANQARDAGNWQLAARNYRRALQKMPDAAAIWVQFGHSLKESGDAAAAEGAYRRAMELSPDDADVHRQLGFLLRLQGRIDEAVASYLRSAALDPAHPFPREELIRLGWTADGIASQPSLR